MAEISNSASAHLSQEILNSVLRYEPETGKLFWKERPVSMFPNLRSCRSWNSQHAGKQALHHPMGKGYKGGSILGRKAYSHRVICTMVFGHFEGEPDHDNGVKDDNRLHNLIIGSHRDNMKNLPVRSDNSSGHHGITWDSSRKKWMARVCRTYLGRFEDINDAIAARKAAEAEHGYHPNHGRKSTL